MKRSLQSATESIDLTGEEHVDLTLNEPDALPPIKIEDNDYFDEQEGGSAFQHTLQQIYIQPRGKATDINDYVDKIAKRLKHYITAQLREHHGVKFNIAIEVDYDTNKDSQNTVKGFWTTRNRVVHSVDEIDDIIEEIKMDLHHATKTSFGKSQDWSSNPSTARLSASASFSLL